VVALNPGASSTFKRESILRTKVDPKIEKAVFESVNSKKEEAKRQEGGNAGSHEDGAEPATTKRSRPPTTSALEAPSEQKVTVEKLLPSISLQSDCTIATIGGALPRAASEQDDVKSCRIIARPRRDSSLADDNIEFDTRPEDLQQELVRLAVLVDHEEEGRRNFTHNYTLSRDVVHCNDESPAGKEGLEESKCDDPDEGDFDSSSEDHDSDDDDDDSGGGGDDDHDDEDEEEEKEDEDDDEDDDVEHDSDDDDDCSDENWGDEDTDDGTFCFDPSCHKVLFAGTKLTFEEQWELKKLKRTQEFSFK
jgi:hypothetical protein